MQRDIYSETRKEAILREKEKNGEVEDTQIFLFFLSFFLFFLLILFFFSISAERKNMSENRVWTRMRFSEND